MVLVYVMPHYIILYYGILYDMNVSHYDSAFRRLRLNLKGWKSHVRRKIPGNLESGNLGRDDIISRKIGRSPRRRRV